MPIFGAKSRAKRGCASKLSCGHRIDPAERTGFTEVSGEFAISQWADRVVGPYKRISNISQYNAQNRHSPRRLCLLLLSADHKLAVFQKIRLSAGEPEAVRVDVRFQKPGFVAGQDLRTKRLPFRIPDRVPSLRSRSAQRFMRSLKQTNTS